MNAPEKIAMKNGLYASLVRAQASFAPAIKQSTNPHFKSKYVDLAGCVDAVIDALNANGIFLMQPTHECADGVTVETLFIHESGESLSAGKLHVPASKNDAQGYGSALTYARRYSLMAACGIAPEDDDGNAASKRVKAPSDAEINDAVKLLTIAAKGGKESLDAELAKVPDAVKAMIPPSTKKAIAALTKEEVTA